MIASTKKAREDAVTVVVRTLASIFALICIAGAGSESFAETYPARPVRLVVPFGAGGPTDVIARIVAQKLSEAWGQQVYTENMPGAGGNTGVAAAARTAPDGYTMLVVSTGFMVNPSMYAKIPYDPVKDFAPVTLVAASPNVVSVNPGFAAKTLKELIELVNAHPGTYSFAQPSTGSTPHLAGELFKQQYHLDPVSLPFNSAALAINSTIGGHTPIAFTALPPAMTNVKEGKLRALAVLSVMRSSALPEVPTNAEAGVPDLESDTLTGIVAPAGTAKDIIERWRTDIAKTVAAPDVKERLEKLGVAPEANTPEEFGARIKAEIAKWSKVVHDANIRAEGPAVQCEKLGNARRPWLACWRLCSRDQASRSRPIILIGRSRCLPRSHREARSTWLRACSRRNSPSASASNSTSRTIPAAAAISAPHSARGRRPTATRCSAS